MITFSDFFFPPVNFMYLEVVGYLQIKQIKRKICDTYIVYKLGMDQKA